MKISAVFYSYYNTIATNKRDTRAIVAPTARGFRYRIMLTKKIANFCTGFGRSPRTFVLGLNPAAHQELFLRLKYTLSAIRFLGFNREDFALVEKGIRPQGYVEIIVESMKRFKAKVFILTTNSASHRLRNDFKYKS